MFLEPLEGQFLNLEPGGVFARSDDREIADGKLVDGRQPQRGTRRTRSRLAHGRETVQPERATRQADCLDPHFPSKQWRQRQSDGVFPASDQLLACPRPADEQFRTFDSEAGEQHDVEFAQQANRQSRAPCQLAFQDLTATRAFQPVVGQNIQQGWRQHEQQEHEHQPAAGRSPHRANAASRHWCIIECPSTLLRRIVAKDVLCRT